MTTKRCAKCTREQPIAEFCAMASAVDGLHCWCRECRTSYGRAWRASRPAGYHVALTDKMRAKYPHKQRARSAVDAEVASGRMTPAREHQCTDCGAQAFAYDHAHGYDPPHELDVEPVCSRCHGLRSRARGEHARPRARGFSPPLNRQEFP